MLLPDNPRIPCILCGRMLEIRIDKNEKPYFICDPCGLQAFVRCKSGVEKLCHLVKDFQQSDSGFFDWHKSSLELISLISRLSALRDKKQELEESKTITDHLFPKKELEHAESAIDSELKRLHKRLRKIKLEN